MPKTQRVVFSFDDRSLESLKRITEQGRYPSMANAVRESLQINRALQNQAEQGFTEVIVRNPETKEERVIVIPNLHS
jgi:Arc/MetJ-type ribon-helix-helix transcriptional regulator